MPPRIPNFPAHASLDVWQESWLLSRSSRIAGSAPGATTHDRPPALPRVTRDGALASPADGAAPVDERLRLGRAALSECLQAGGGCAGLLPARRAASSARPARARAPPAAPGAASACLVASPTGVCTRTWMAGFGSRTRMPGRHDSSPPTARWTRRCSAPPSRTSTAAGMRVTLSDATGAGSSSHVGRGLDTAYTRTRTC